MIHSNSPRGKALIARIAGPEVLARANEMANGHEALRRHDHGLLVQVTPELLGLYDAAGGQCDSALSVVSSRLDGSRHMVVVLQLGGTQLRVAMPLHTELTRRLLADAKRECGMLVVVLSPTGDWRVSEVGDVRSEVSGQLFSDYLAEVASQPAVTADDANYALTVACAPLLEPSALPSVTKGTTVTTAHVAMAFTWPTETGGAEQSSRTAQASRSWAGPGSSRLH